MEKASAYVRGTSQHEMPAVERLASGPDRPSAILPGYFGRLCSEDSNRWADGARQRVNQSPHATPERQEEAFCPLAPRFVFRAHRPYQTAELPLIGDESGKDTPGAQHRG